MTHFDHDHRERENVRFLAVCSLVQNLWRSPSWGVTTLTRGALHGIQVLGDHSKPKIYNARSIRVIYKDVWLAGCQHCCKTRFVMITYSLEVPVDHIAGVEVAEALRDIG